MPVQYKNATTVMHSSSQTDSLHEEEHIVRATGASWEAEYSGLANEISMRHYFSKTLKTYEGWVPQFQTFTRSKPPVNA